MQVNMTLSLENLFAENILKTGCSEEMLKFGLIAEAKNFENPSDAVEVRLYLKTRKAIGVKSLRIN